VVFLINISCWVLSKILLPNMPPRPFRFPSKGQLISKWLFGVFKFFQKTNENKSIWGIIVVKLNLFICFWKRYHEKIISTLSHVWPLVSKFNFDLLNVWFDICNRMKGKWEIFWLLDFSFCTQ
jgi:hypothetical protein